MCVLEVKSIAWNPTRSMVGAISRICAELSPVAPQRLWLPSRMDTSTRRTSVMAVAFCVKAFEPVRVDASGDERGIVEKRAVNLDIGFHDLYSAVVERNPCAREGVVAVRTLNDDLGQQ